MGNLTDLDEEMRNLEEMVSHYEELLETTELISSMYSEDGLAFEVRVEPKPLGKAGWYQNPKGELFHFDGVVWDVVPEERTAELEYLG